MKTLALTLSVLLLANGGFGSPRDPVATAVSGQPDRCAACGNGSTFPEGYPVHSFAAGGGERFETPAHYAWLPNTCAFEHYYCIIALQSQERVLYAAAKGDQDEVQAAQSRMATFSQYDPTLGRLVPSCQLARLQGIGEPQGSAI